MSNLCEVIKAATFDLGTSIVQIDEVDGKEYTIVVVAKHFEYMDVLERIKSIVFSLRMHDKSLFDRYIFDFIPFSPKEYEQLS